MNEAELREKIADVMYEDLQIAVEYGVNPYNQNVPEVADAILALVLPAIQAARMEALREAEQIARGDLFDFAPSEYLRGNNDAANGIADAIAALIEKETAP